MEQERHLWKIGDLAEKAGVTVRTLRYYEELGLLPFSEVTTGGFRLYTEKDLNRVLFIRQFKDLGFSLSEIKELLSEARTIGSREERIAASRSLLEKQLQQIKNKISDLESSRGNLEKAIKALETCRSCRTTPCPPACPNQKVLL